MNISDDSPYGLPKELLRAASDATAQLRRSLEYVDGGFLLQRETRVLEFKTGAGNVVALRGNDLLNFLQPLVSTPTFDSATPTSRPPAAGVSLATTAGKKMRDFVELYFYELRALVCKKNKKTFPVSPGTTVAIAGVTHWLLEHFGIQEEYAKTMATAILVALLTATKGTFCKMTENEAKAALGRLHI
jgi:hypothetical protein